MEENNNKPEMDVLPDAETKTKKEVTSRDILRIVGLVLGVYFILKGFWGILTQG